MTRKLTTDLARTLFNPLLCSRGLNYLSEEEETEQTKHIRELYAAGIKQTSKNNLVWGLEVDYSDVDCGNGGFLSAGYMPPFFGNLYKDSDMQKELSFYWPKDHKSGKYMSLVGAINLGSWPKAFHDLTAYNVDQWNRLSFAGGRELDNSWYEPRDTWMYFFVSHRNDFETSIPDCHVRQVHFSKSERHNRCFSETVLSKMWDWQKNQTVMTSVVAPPKYFTNIRPRFYYDGTGYPDKEKGIFAYGEGDCSVYGPPNSQQEPKRYISPESYFLRALTPIFSFSDDGTDMTHQFYADTSIFDSIYHTRPYCKLDSSCT